MRDRHWPDKYAMGRTLLDGSDERDPEYLSGIDFELVPLLDDGETRIDNREMRRRALLMGCANLGQRSGGWLLDHQNKIPKQPKGYQSHQSMDAHHLLLYIPLPGTVLLDPSYGPDGFEVIRFLTYEAGGWHPDSTGVLHWWDHHAYLLRPRKERLGP